MGERRAGRGGRTLVAWSAILVTMALLIASLASAAVHAARLLDVRVRLRSQEPAR